jgi:YgiT-type zinc finger domain-containing protein
MELRFSKEEAMRCTTCDSGERQPARRARVAERNGATAVVLGVPVEVCASCGQVWLAMDTAIELDARFNRLLASGAELAQAHWETPVAA